MPGAPVVREHKTRRTREDVRRSAPGGWDSKEGGAGKRDKEDVVDYHIVEILRKGNQLNRGSLLLNLSPKKSVILSKTIKRRIELCK